MDSEPAADVVRGAVGDALPPEAARARRHSWTLESHVHSIAHARRVVTQACADWGHEEAVDGEVNTGPGAGAGLAINAKLVVSELVTNAVRHAWGPISLEFFEVADGVRIEVRDGSPLPPVHLDGHDDGVGGYGVAVVALLANWGWRPEGEGKVVWAILPRRA